MARQCSKCHGIIPEGEDFCPKCTAGYDSLPQSSEQQDTGTQSATPTMPDNVNLKCSRCGSTSISETRYSACVSKSCWQGENYPVPSMPTWVNDDIEIWHVALCDSCLTKGYIDFLSGEVRKSIKFLKLSPFMFFGSIIGFTILRFFFGTEGVSKLEELSAIPFLLYSAAGIMLAGLLIVSIVGVPFNIIRYILNSKRLTHTKETLDFPKARADNAFIGEAQRIIDALETKTEGRVIGSFTLPRYKGRHKHPENRKKNLTNRTRNILGVYPSLSKLQDSLPSEWKDLLQNKLSQSK